MYIFYGYQIIISMYIKLNAYVVDIIGIGSVERWLKHVYTTKSINDLSWSNGSLGMESLYWLVKNGIPMMQPEVSLSHTSSGTTSGTLRHVHEHTPICSYRCIYIYIHTYIYIILIYTLINNAPNITGSDLLEFDTGLSII